MQRLAGPLHASGCSVDALRETYAELTMYMRLGGSPSRWITREQTGRLGCALVATAITTAPAVAAQQLTTIAGDETYCTCAVTLEHVVTLGDTSGPGMLLGEVRAVRRNSQGIYYVLAWNEHQIYRFTPEGKALPPIIGKGSGPGEAIDINIFEMVADSVITFDSMNDRMTVFGPDGHAVRTLAGTGYVYDAVYVPGAGVILNARGYDAGSRGVPLHFLGVDGRRVRSFGGPPLEGLDQLLWIRHIVGFEDAVWWAAQDRYQLERWSLDGTMEQSIDRRMPGFEPRVHREWGGPDEPIKPWIVDMTVDGRGYLRTIVLRGSPRWAELIGAPARQPSGGRMIYQAVSGVGLFESIIEIIDPRSGRLFARGVLEPELWGFIDPEHVFSYSEDDIGRPTISVWRLRLSAGG